MADVIMSAAPVVDKHSSSGLDFKLHPLVLISISDHYTRTKAMSRGSAAPVQRVLGCLLGQQTGRSVDISNSFELNYELLADGSVVINTAFLIKKQEQYKQVFPQLDVVGWYATGSQLLESDAAVHQKIQEINESPVHLQLNPDLDPSRKELPVQLYETEMHVLDGVATTAFVKAKHTIETSEAERIGVNQVAKITPFGVASGSEQLTSHMTGVHSAIKMLTLRMADLHNILVAMQTGTKAVDHALLRQTSSLLHSLPASATSDFDKEYLTETNDSMLTLLLSTLTKNANLASEVIEKYNQTYVSRRGGR